MTKSPEAVYPRPLRLLIVEDNPRDAELIVASLKRAGYPLSFEVVDKAEEFQRQILREDFDVILSDHNLANWKGADALTALTQTGKAIPFIVVTGSLGDEAAVGYIKAGAADYVLKARLERLPAAVGQALREKAHRDEELRLHEAIRAGKREWELTFDSVPSPILLLDRDCRILRANATAAEAAGLSFKELIGQPCDQVTPRAGNICADCPQNREFSMACEGGGAEKIFDARCNPLRDAKGGISGFVFTMHDVTARRNAEAALQASEAQYRLLFESNPQPMWVFDRETLAFLAVNEAAVRNYGYSREEFAKMTIKDLCPEENIPPLLEGVSYYIEGLDRSGEWRHMTKPGRLIHVEITSHSILFDGRDAVLVLAADVTERKRAEEELYQSRHMLQSILNTLPQRVFWKDRNISYLGCNKAFAMDAGLKDPVEIIGKNDYELAWRATAELYRGDDKLVIESEAPRLNFEETQKRPDGSVWWLRTSKLPMRDREGKVIGVIGIYEDITDRKQAEAEKTRLVTAIEQSAEGVLITTAAGNIEYVNPAFTRITGYSREEVLGKTPKILKSGEQDPAFYGRLWATILKGEIWHGEIVNRRKDGKAYTEEMNIAPVRNPAGEITHFIATKQDVTERKRLEDQLRQAQKMESVGRLAGGVAHDFNNLLTIINGYSDMTLEHLHSGDPIRSFIEEITKAGARATSLTRQLLAFSRRQVLVPRVLDLNALVADVERMLRRLIGEDIGLAVVRDSALGRVKADPGQIEQVLMNLAVNARDAMPQGGKLVIETANIEFDDAYVRSHTAIMAGRYVMLAVSDTGIGMDAEVRDHIFEPFFTTKEQGKGTGLGLATVYGIVKQSGGHIWVYSEPGQGTSFKIYLPWVKEDAESVPASEAREHAGAGSETILLVEDEEAVRALAVRILQGLGYTVLESMSPEDALLIVERRKEPIDLLLTDVVLPGMSGRKIAERLAFLRPGIKVLYMSGYTDDSIVRNGVLEANTAFLQKPFTPAALARKVREVLDSGRAEGS